MKGLNIVTLILCIIGGLNWGLVGIAHFNLVDTIFGGADSVGSRIVYIIVGLSALYQLIPMAQAFSVGEVRAEGASYRP